MKRNLLWIAPLALAGCQTWAPTWSEVTGALPDANAGQGARPTVVALIDGASPISAVPRVQRQAEPLQRQIVPQGTIRIDPGRHDVALATVHPSEVGPLASAGNAAEVTRFQLDAAPCERYYVNAQVDAANPRVWKPFVNAVEPIVGCSVAAR
jgi:hypothetical protein